MALGSYAFQKVLQTMAGDVERQATNEGQASRVVVRD